jgi:Bacterial SH3 domain
MILLLPLLLCFVAEAEIAPGGQDRQYDFPIVAVQTALRQMGAYTGSRLPTLDGFITMTKAEMPHYQRPYYEYKIDLEPVASNHTLVHVKANISAWCDDPGGGQASYQAFASNGRLEGDLLDRLAEYLAKNKSDLVTEPGVMEHRIAAVREQETEAQRRIADLQKQLEALQAAAAQTDPPEYVAVDRTHVVVRQAPQAGAAAVLQAQPDDEFEVLARRGAWVQVKLDDATQGWVEVAQVKLNQPAAKRATADSVSGGAATPTIGYTIVRENVSDFSGDWPPLKGKTVLYAWARPLGSSLNVSPTAKLRFVEFLLRDRGREALHDSQNKLDGIVVIFLDESSGVAAASFSDVRQWLDGNLTEAAFLKKCSLDPPSQFLAAAPPARHR